MLVAGEANRGKSTLVNALFGAPLLPTGAFPLTSVVTGVMWVRRCERRCGIGGDRARARGTGTPTPPPSSTPAYGTRRAVRWSLRAGTGTGSPSRGELLCVELTEIVDLSGLQALRPPSFDASVHPGWEELVSAVVKRRLPVRIRRLLLHELDDWQRIAVRGPSAGPATPCSAACGICTCR